MFCWQRFLALYSGLWLPTLWVFLFLCCTVLISTNTNIAVPYGSIFSLSVHLQNQSDIICLDMLTFKFVSSPQLLQSSDARTHLLLDIFS